MNNFQKPNLPDEGTVLICDKTVPLSHRFKNFIPSKCIPELPPSMRYHTDLQLCYVDCGFFIAAPQVYDYYREKLSPLGATVINGKVPVGGTYGADCAYNILMMGKYAFHNTKFTPPAAAELFEKKGIKLVHVNQGYTKCSAAPINETAAITADPSIKKAMDTLGFDCLLIEWQGVHLEGYSHGFFGGCSARISKNEFFVCGSLKNHPSKDKIIGFLEKHNMVLKETDDKLTDIGSIIIA